MTDGRKTYMSDGITYTRNIILRGMSAIYLIAFLSFYYQSPGLFGNNGIAPARLQIEPSPKNLLSSILRKPTILYLAPYGGLDTEYMIDVLALLGSFISFAGFVSQKVCILPTFALLWILYNSLIQISHIFANQSDYLLLEAGFVMIMLAPLSRSYQPSSSDKVIFVVLRWLLMRFHFASGVVKLFSHCPLWWNFTALNYHFETMALPTPLAWYSHHLPAGWLKLTNIFANVTELGCVWLYFFPHRTVRRYIFYWQIFLQFNIIVTGNYGFLNIMLVILALSLLDDQFLAEQNLKRTVILLTKILLIGYVFIFGISFTISSSLNGLKLEEWHLEMLRKTVRPAPLIAIFVIISTFLLNLVSHPVITNARSYIQKVYGVNTLISFSIIAISMIMMSMVPHGNLDSRTNITNTDLGSFYQQVKQFHIVNEYGQDLRKMRNERHEIIYEYSDDIDGPWIEYEFIYKPVNVNSSLPFAGPYLPRLDLKMYDASSVNYRKELWTLSLAYRLLQEQQSVLALLGKQSSITSPKYVRAMLYKFQYTSPFTSAKGYWIRQKVSEYFPAFSMDDMSLLAYLKSMKISPNYKEVKVENQILKIILDFFRNRVRILEGSLLIAGVLAAGFVIILSEKFIKVK